ncbi:MAG: NAD-dependent epimerase/dehydratase family protein [Betaproteobacteria bacterium]|jgi:UDP-glucose 4-epimerase
MDKPKRVLITGAAGLLGSRLAEWLEANEPDVEIMGIDDFSGGYKSNVAQWLTRREPKNGLYFHRTDMYNLDELKELFNNFKPDVVYHLAAYAAEGLSPFIRGYNYINNTVATANVITCCIEANVKRLVFTSSMAVYGVNTPPFDESYTPAPIDPYGIAKYACEMDIRAAGEQHSLDWCIIRPHNVYGRNQNVSDSYRNVLGIWMYRILQGEPIVIFGDGKQRRAFSCIDDSLAPMWRASFFPAASKEIINLGGIEATSIRDAALELCNVTGGANIQFAEARHEVKEAFSTWEKSENILGFEHSTSLYDGLSEMWNWVNSLGEIPPRLVWDRYELDVGLYQFWTKENMTQGSHQVISRRPKITLE